MSAEEVASTLQEQLTKSVPGEEIDSVGIGALSAHLCKRA